MKQVIVMRTDLNMRKGKTVVQGCHASLKVILDNLIKYRPKVDGCFNLEHSWYPELDKNFYRQIKSWLEGIFTKICLRVDSEQEMIDIYNKAKENNVPCSLITDCGKTEFHGVPTNTCIAIGPAEEKEIDKLTGHLKLL